MRLALFCLPADFLPETRFVALQFVELGGDHLDRLVRFQSSSGDLDVQLGSNLEMDMGQTFI